MKYPFASSCHTIRRLIPPGLIGSLYIALSPLSEAALAQSVERIPSMEVQASKLDVGHWHWNLVLAVIPQNVQDEVRPLSVWVDLANKRAIALAPVVSAVLAPLGATVFPGVRGFEPDARVRFQIGVFYADPIVSADVAEHNRRFDNVKGYLSVQPHVVHIADQCVTVALQYNAPLVGKVNAIHIYVGKRQLDTSEVSCVLNSVFHAIGFPVSASEAQWRRGVTVSRQHYAFTSDAKLQVEQSVVRFRQDGARIMPKFLLD